MIDRQPIPNINIGQVYDQRYSDAEVHYDKLGNLAELFGRNMPVHQHDRFFQVHYVKSGAVRVAHFTPLHASPQSQAVADDDSAFVDVAGQAVA
jgi:hypothetical protein